MMRAFFISATVLSIIFIVACAGISSSVSSARWDYLWNSTYDDYSTDYYDDYSYDDYSYDDYGYGDSYEEAENMTRVGGIVSVLYMLISAGAFLLALMKIKTKTMKVISIIGMSLAGLLFLIAMVPTAVPDEMYFDECAGVFILGAIALLGLHVVGIVHAFKTST